MRWVLQDGYTPRHLTLRGGEFLRRQCRLMAGSRTVAGVDFHAATGMDAVGIAQVRVQGRQRILRTFVRHGLQERSGRDDGLATRRRFLFGCLGVYRWHRPGRTGRAAAQRCTGQPSTRLALTW